MLAGGMPFSLTLPLSQCVVPQGLNGAVAIWITSDDQSLNGGAVDRQSNAVVAGPLMVFIDIHIDVVSTLVRNKGNSSGSSSSNSSSSSDSGSSNSTMSLSSSFASTTTVSPSDAAAIIGTLSASTATPSASAPASPPPNNVVPNGVSMVPKPTST